MKSQWKVMKVLFVWCLALNVLVNNFEEACPYQRWWFSQGQNKKENRDRAINDLDNCFQMEIIECETVFDCSICNEDIDYVVKLESMYIMTMKKWLNMYQATQKIE